MLHSKSIKVTMNRYNRVVIKVGSSVLTEKGEIAKNMRLYL